MKPDRSNYEIWLIDLLEDNLDENRKNELLQFFKDNPDIREEFEMIASSKLTPEAVYFTQKDKLSKAVSDLPESQVQYLSVASMEGDITPEQLSELEKNINLHPENRKIFESVRKIRLVPPEIIYSHKDKIIKKTWDERVRRYAYAGLRAAATIAILVLSYLLIPGMLKNDEKTTSDIILKTIPDEPLVVRTMAFHAPAPEKKSTSEQVIPTAVISETEPLSVASEIMPVETITVISAAPEVIPVRDLNNISVIPSGNISSSFYGSTLALSNIAYNPVQTEDDRSRLSKFIARNFREKLLKEKGTDDKPLKSYEIAEAGIEGLNKLLGWEMALVKTTDEAGDLKSLYFSSKVLKFNAPVKKTEVAR